MSKISNKNENCKGKRSGNSLGNAGRSSCGHRLRKMLPAAMFLVMALVLGACSDSGIKSGTSAAAQTTAAAAQNAAPAQNVEQAQNAAQAAESDAAAGAYQILVTDTDGKPVKDAMVQFCSDTQCMFTNTGEDGLAVFEAGPGAYKVHILKVPAGFVSNTKEYEAKEGGEVTVITLEKE